MTTPLKEKSFPLAAVLTVTTGRLLTEMDHVYEILNWVTGDDVYTHQIPRALQAAGPLLLKRFPELVPASGGLRSLDSWIAKDHTGGHEGIRMWLTELQMMFPAIKDSYQIAPISAGQWEHIDPVLEAGSMFDPEKIITIGDVR